MSQPAGLKRDFKLVLNGVRPDSFQAVAQELTHLFPLDPANAMNIVKSAPIILLDELTPQEARTVGTYSIRLRALGADVQVTGQPVGKLQVLRWPLLPDIAKRPGTHIICPSCGARLQVQVSVPGAPEAPLPEAQPAPQQFPEEPVMRLAPEVQPLPVQQPVPGAEAIPSDVEPGAGEEAVLLDFAAEEPVEFADGEVVIEEEPLPEGEAPAEGAGGGSCRVMLVGKIKGDKKLKAGELMSYYLAISEDEALSELSKKTVVTVAKDMTPERAEECKNRFAGIGVKVTIKG